MSWEANTWASKQRMKLPQEQLVLYVLGNCADPDGVAFSKWPGRDHWWKYLAKLTRLSKSSLFRHINTLVALGLATRSIVVLGDGSRRPTISLDLDASFDIDHEQRRYDAALHSHGRDQSHSETGSDEDVNEAENDNESNSLNDETESTSAQSHGETGPTSGTDPVPPAGMHIYSKLDSNTSPLPPASGGTAARDEEWDQFVKAWGDPIPKLALANANWQRVPTEKRSKAIAAARGYWAWLRAHPKPPPPISAQAFLRDDGGWDQWLRYMPNDAGQVPAATGYACDSAEFKALRTLFDLAGKTDAFFKIYVRGERVFFSRPVTLRMLALANVAKKDAWGAASRQQAAAWEHLLRDCMGDLIRRPIREGDRVPLEGNGWPPKVDGTWSPTGPPDTLLTEQDVKDMQDFK